MDYWVIWLIFAVVLGVAEIFTLTTALGLLGGAALITSVAAGLGLPLVLQFVVFAASLLTGVVVVRPIVKRHLMPPPSDRRFGVQALVGKPAYVLREVTGRDGRVQIGGEEWSARAYDETLVIPAGAVVDVIEIEGATALVYPRE